MPLNAIQIDHVDYIFSPQEIASKLIAISKNDVSQTESSLKLLWMKGLMPDN
jgi:hypothetical protein